eukprot:g2708.t1
MSIEQLQTSRSAASSTGSISTSHHKKISRAIRRRQAAAAASGEAYFTLCFHFLNTKLTAEELQNVNPVGRVLVRLDPKSDILELETKSIGELTKTNGVSSNSWNETLRFPLTQTDYQSLLLCDNFFTQHVTLSTADAERIGQRDEVLGKSSAFPIFTREKGFLFPSNDENEKKSNVQTLYKLKNRGIEIGEVNVSISIEFGPTFRRRRTALGRLLEEDTKYNMPREFREITPDDVRTLAEEFSINVEKEYHLLWLLRQLLLDSPLPPQWRFIPGSGDSIGEYRKKTYYNEVTGVLSTKHPCSSFFRRALRKERQRTPYPPPPLEDPPTVDVETNDSGNVKLPRFLASEWMDFTETDYSTGLVKRYFFNFRTGEESIKLPLHSVPVNDDGDEVDDNARKSPFSSMYGEKFEPEMSQSMNHGPSFSTIEYLSSSSVKKGKRNNNFSKKGKKLVKLDNLQFTSWWMEQRYSGEMLQEQSQGGYGGMKRFSIRLIYHLFTGNFEVRLGSAREEAFAARKSSLSAAHKIATQGSNDRADAIYMVRNVNGKHGQIESCDLYVGARIKLMGAWVTLMQADKKTERWLQEHGTRLQSLRNTLWRQLKKYNGNLKPNAFKSGKFLRGGKTNLRLLLNDIRGLKVELEQFRPKLVEKILRNAQDAGESLVGIFFDQRSGGNKSNDIDGSFTGRDSLSGR